MNTHNIASRVKQLLQTLISMEIPVVGIDVAYPSVSITLGGVYSKIKIGVNSLGIVRLYHRSHPKFEVPVTNLDIPSVLRILNEA
jgi:hypothetical protein